MSPRTFPLNCALYIHTHIMHGRGWNNRYRAVTLRQENNIQLLLEQDSKLHAEVTWPNITSYNGRQIMLLFNKFNKRPKRPEISNGDIPHYRYQASTWEPQTTRRCPRRNLHRWYPRLCHKINTGLIIELSQTLTHYGNAQVRKLFLG